MSEAHPHRSGLTAAEVVVLSEREALSRLDLLATVSRILDGAIDEYDSALEAVARACVADFADLCAIEVADGLGGVRVCAVGRARPSSLRLRGGWKPAGRTAAPDGRPVLVYGEGDDPPAAAEVRTRIGADSLLVVPVGADGVTVAWFVAATGPLRRGLRPSALKVAVDLGSRIGTAIQRVALHREMQESAREQNRTVLRLRRLATAATRLAGAATPQGVLETACREACVIHDAAGAVARWSRADGSTVQAAAGRVGIGDAAAAFDAAAAGRVSRGADWVAYPLPSTDPWQHGALVVYTPGTGAGEDEPVLSSLASLIPVALERALVTETAVHHEARLQAVVDASPVALAEIDTKGSVRMANRSAQELLGLEVRAGGGIGAGSLAVPLSELAGEVHLAGAVVTRNIQVAERELSVSGAPMPALHAGDAPSVLLAGVDLSEMRRAQRALIQAQRLDAMGQVAGKVAHDFNNLLTLIVGYAAILRRGIDDDKQLSLIANIEEASKRAAHLTMQMLDMTRQKVDSGVVIDLGQAVKGLDAVLSRVAGPMIDLAVRTSRNVIKVRLDPSEMEQIVLNLVINARDAMAGEGHISVSVQVAAPPPSEQRELDLPPGPLALISVADDGPGMAPEVLHRCLEPFFTTKERGRGTGLGLSTVYGLVRERGGQLHIDSAPGDGTRIRIWIPLEREAPVTSSADDDETWPAGRTVSGRVLLVEDETDLGEVAEDALRSIGIAVTTCASAEEALAVLQAGQVFDVLVTDVLLPRMSGIDLARAGREVRPGLPVLLMTGYAGTPDDPPTQGDPVIRKPYRPDVLRLKVAEMVEVGRLRNRRRGQGSNR